MERFAPDMGLPAHHETVIYILQILRLVEAGERPDSIRLDEWDEHKALLNECNNFDRAGAFMNKDKSRPHTAAVRFWDEFIQKLKGGDIPDTFTIEQARRFHLAGIDNCKDNVEIKY